MDPEKGSSSPTSGIIQSLRNKRKMTMFKRGKKEWRRKELSAYHEGRGYSY